MLNPILLAAICAVVSFFIGAIPFGLILGRVFNHTDIRKAGSGNIGTTNALRVAGPRWPRSRCCSTALRAPSALSSPVAHRELGLWLPREHYGPRRRRRLDARRHLPGGRVGPYLLALP
mgnify:CR=1 FL=1